jgi:hypothetical protein
MTRKLEDFQPQPGRPGYVILHTDDPGVYTILRTCMLCGQPSEVDVPAQGLWNWEHGEFVQKAFPGLSPAERETVMNGSHDVCFNVAFREEDDDEDASGEASRDED